MKARASGAKRVTVRARPRIVSSELRCDRAREINDAVARRAYEIFERRGRADGHHEEDWRQAEAELLYPLTVTVSDAGPCFSVEAGVPGFDACDIEVCVESRRVTIAGERRSGGGPGAGLQTWMFRAVELPEDVDTTDVSAAVEDGVVEVMLRKMAAPAVRPLD